MNLNDSTNDVINASNDDTLVNEDVTITSAGSNAVRRKIFTQKNIVVGVLFTINLVNFMDRFTIAG